MAYTTIKDIAKALGVSTSTVSRALRNEANIKSETKERVRTCAESMGYEPNYIAVTLRQKQSKVIGIIVPEMVTTFFITIINAMQERLLEFGYKVIITQSQENSNVELNNLHLLENYRVDGIIMSICCRNKNEDEYLRLQKKGLNIVFFDRVPAIDASKVIIDDYSKSFLLVEHLIRSGYKRIVHLAGPPNLQNALDRKRGYQDALTKFKMNGYPELLVDSGISFEDGEHSMKKLIEEKKLEFDAVFCFTDTLAIGAKKYLQSHGYRIPNDVALAGFSGSLLSTIIHPQLTTVEQPLIQMAHTSVDLLLEKINDKSSTNKTVMLDANIKIRASSNVI